MNESVVLSFAGLASTALAMSFRDVPSRALFAGLAIVLFIASVLAWAMSGGRR